MAIPKRKGHKASRDRELRKLQRATIEENQVIRNHLRRARVYYIEMINGNADALEDAKEQLALAIENGMAPNAITVGPPTGMVNKINDLLDRPTSQSHAVGSAYICLFEVLNVFSFFSLILWLSCCASGFWIKHSTS